MSSLSKVRDIFYSGDFSFSGEIEPINEIAFLLDEGYLFLEPVEVAEKSEYVRVVEEIAKRHAHAAATGGGHTHMALKVLASKYLLATKRLNSRFEQAFCGYFPDVLSDDKTIAVECGHTQNPSKMLDYFRQGEIREFIQIPYPDESDEIIKGFIFTANRTLNEFLKFLGETNRNKIKELLRKKNER